MSDWKSEVTRRLAAFDLPAADEARIVEELSQHLDDRVAELRQQGESENAARRKALDEISDEELRRGGWRALALGAPAEHVPGRPSGHIIDSLARDLRYAVRSLWRQRGFTIAAILALAIGIGGTTAIFGAVDAVLLRPMPFPHADRLFVPVGMNPARNIPRSSIAFADAEDWRASGLFAEVAVWRPGAADLTGAGDPERVQIAIVSQQFFRLIDVTPLAGRTLRESDHEPGAPEVIVIGHAMWQQRFGGAGDVVGRRVTLGGVPREIVGVLPARRVWPATVALFVPMDTAGFGPDVRERRDNMIFNALARLRDGVAPEQARLRMTEMAARLGREYPKERQGWTNTLVPLRDYIVDVNTSLALYVLLGAVAAVLLIACANVANLALVRGSGRARELAVRVSLGASRRRLIQQLLVEGLVLTAVGVAGGVALAALVMPGLVAIAPLDTPFLEDIEISGRVLLAAGLAGALAAVIAGMIPAMSVSSIRVSGALRDGSAAAGTSRRTARLRNALVIAEIAATVVLVTCSALLIRSFERILTVDPGVTLDRVVTGRIAIPAARYDTPARRQQFADDLVARLEQRPDIQRAALSSFVPAGAGGFGLGRLFLPEGRPDSPDGTGEQQALWNVVTPHYFDTLGIRIVEGRSFDTREQAGSTPVMIVSKHFAERMFPGESAIGKRVKSSRDENIYREVVGVAAEVRYWGLAERERAPLVYVPFAQDQFSGLIVARSRGDKAEAILNSVRRALTDVDPQMAVADLRTLKASADRSIATERYSTLLLSILAAVALILSALGIYGVTSYLFLLRRREMGIRLALGASRRNLYALVFRHGFVLTSAGLALGLAGAIACSRWLDALLFNTTQADPAAWSTMIGVVAISTALACMLPARRAASESPTVALRVD